MSLPSPETPRTCAVCGKPEQPRFRPFCSGRCADIDLGRWLKGSYVILGHEAEEGERPSAPPNSDGDGGDRS